MTQNVTARDCLKCKLGGWPDDELAKYLSENDLPFTVAEFKRILDRYHI